ncbi:hypothetical protein [Rhizobium sp. RAF56]|uniref:hypothetical protein n=1 Tax=Rhizobium sp. RAF56 TaxID=3233062 RepID=UPI003F9A48D6
MAAAEAITQPAPFKAEKDRQEKSKLGLDGEKSDRDAGKYRPPFPQAEAVEQQRGGQKAVLHQNEIAENPR